MKILLDLEDRPYVLKQLSKLYQELPQDIRSRKSVLPASEVILEAMEYMSSLKSKLEKYSAQGGTPKASSNPVPEDEEGIPSELKERFAVHHPLLYDTLKRLKSIPDLQLLSFLLQEKPKSPSETPCFPLEVSIIKAHLIVYRAVRDPHVESILRFCCTPSCINPHHYFEHASDVFLRTLGRRVVNKKDPSGGAQAFLQVLVKKLNAKEIKMLTKGFSGDRKDCFPVTAHSFPNKGEIEVKHLKEYVQHLLFKTFRFHTVTGELCLMSTEACSVSMGTSRESLLCLNPWHFEPVAYNVEKRTAYRYLYSIEHTCSPRLVVNLSFSKFMCRLCWSDIPSGIRTLMKKGEERFAELLEPTVPNGASQYPILQVKSLSLTSSEERETTEKPDTELQVPVGSVPESSFDSSSRVKPSDSISAIVSEGAPVAKAIRSSKPKSSPILRERSTRKRKIQPIFQCWKCLVKFTTNSELENHPCTSRQRFDEDEEELNKLGGKEKVLQVKIERLDNDYEFSPPAKKSKNGSNQESGGGNIVAIKEEVLDEDEYETCLFDEKVVKSTGPPENLAHIEPSESLRLNARS